MMISQQTFTVIIVHIRHTIYSSETNQNCFRWMFQRTYFRLFLNAGRKDKHLHFTRKSFLKIKSWNYQK